VAAVGYTAMILIQLSGMYNHCLTLTKTLLSHSDQEIPFHTDISSETNLHEYMTLFVLNQFELGGGLLQLIQTSEIAQILSSESTKILMMEKFKIKFQWHFKSSVMLIILMKRF
jgi:hypothetical protein